MYVDIDPCLCLFKVIANKPILILSIVVSTLRYVQQMKNDMGFVFL